MIVTYTRVKGQPLTPEQKAMLDALENRPIVYDEDSPAPTPKTMEAFRRAAVERNRRLAREREEAAKSREVL